MVDCNPKATQLDIDLNLSLLGCPDEVNAELQGQHRVDRSLDVFVSMDEFG